jgi:cellulose synthase/poly-beta-1,6-N-acetylglucosamine synthase-like glycosyltransferase
VTASQPTPTVAGELPFVSLHVPAHNEPPDMVIETLTLLPKLDYPRYQVVAIDDNTADEALWRPVEAWCAEHGVSRRCSSRWPACRDCCSRPASAR